MNLYLMGDCPYGLTHDELELILCERLEDFWHWMRDQTMTLCDGRRYNHDAKAYEPDACAETPHGPVVYRYDLHRYLLGLPIMD